MATNKSIELLKTVLLTDAEGNKSRAVHCNGYDTHFDIYTQSSWERSEGILTRHRIQSEEMTVVELEALIQKEPIVELELTTREESESGL
jgi:hypothetical protein